MWKYVLAAGVALGYLMLLGMIDERDQRILAMENAMSLCTPPEYGEILHLTKTDNGWECAYSDGRREWKRSQWNLTGEPA